MEKEKKSLNMTDRKSVEQADGDTSQEKRRMTINESGGVELTSALIEKSGDVPVNKVANSTKVHLKLVKN